MTLPQKEHGRADVVLMLAMDVAEETMLLMEAVAARSVKPGMGIALVTGSIAECQVVRAVQFGLRSVIWRQDAGFDSIAKAVRSVADGCGVLPASVQGWLIDHIGAVRAGVDKHRIPPPPFHYSISGMVVMILEFRIDRRSGVPAFQQIVQQTKQALRLNILVPGDRLPTAKEVSETCAVNPNTTLKAYRELEREGLVEPRPGLGTFVTRTLARPQAGMDSPLYDELLAWMARAREAGLEREDVAALVTSATEQQYDGMMTEARSVNE